MIVRLNNGFFSNLPMQGKLNRNQMMNGNMPNAVAVNMNGNNLAQFGMPINSAQKNLFISKNQQYNQMNNLSAAPVNNQIQRSYNFKQMDHNNSAGSSTPAMSGNLRGSFNNNNMPNNSVNGSNPTSETNQNSNNSNSPATAQVFFLFY